MSAQTHRRRKSDFYTTTEAIRAADRRLVHHSHQPSKAELKQDHRVDATFEETAKAVRRTLKGEFPKPPQSRR